MLTPVLLSIQDRETIKRCVFMTVILFYIEKCQQRLKIVDFTFCMNDLIYIYKFWAIASVQKVWQSSVVKVKLTTYSKYLAINLNWEVHDPPSEIELIKEPHSFYMYFCMIQNSETC